MLKKEQIKNLFEALNEKLRKRGDIGEIGILGGAVMCLVFNARHSTRDVDAVFEPASLIRELAADVGKEHHVGAHWLNDAAKGFLQNAFKREEVFNLSNLRIWSPEAPYMLAMKCISARWDTYDREDVIFLIKYLNLKKPIDVFCLLETYYPKKRIPAKTQFFIEELFEQLS